jgi:hypothetical protein
MGFFSSRKADIGSDNYHVTATTMIGSGGSGAGGLSAGEKSVVKVIRSRFVSCAFSYFFISDEHTLTSGNKLFIWYLPLPLVVFNGCRFALDVVLRCRFLGG